MIEIVEWPHEHFYNDYLIACTDKIYGEDDVVYKEIVKILKNEHGVIEEGCIGFETTQGMTYFVKKEIT